MFTLLKKIALRTPVPSQDDSSLQHRWSAHEASHYPPRRAAADSQTDFVQSDAANTLWTTSVAALREARSVAAPAAGAAPDRPFREPIRYGQVVLGGIHSAVAAALFERRSDISGSVADVMHKNVMVARLLPETKCVWIRSGMDFSDNTLLDVTLRPDSAGPPAGGLFEAFDLFALLWHFGLTNTAALSVWPEKVSEVALQLRRFPPIAPYMLDPRHLALFHILGSGALIFDEIHDEVGAQQAPQLCADLTALVITRSLAFVNRRARSLPTMAA